MAHDHHPKVLVLGPARHSASQSFGPAASKGKGKAKAAQVDDELDDLDLGLGEDVNSIYEAIQDAFKEIHTSKNNPIYTYSTAPSTSSASASFSSWSGSSRSSVGEEAQEIELAWNSDTVIASVGGVQTQRWTMEFEGQDIQWACWGWLEQPGGLGDGVRSTGRDIYATSHSLLSPNSQLHPSKAKPGEFKPYIPNHNTLRPTFGPFADSMNGRTKIEAPSRVRAVFIFLRSIARIFLENGRDYTIHLPFLVRKAWSLHPVGVLVQRVLSKEEETELSHSMAEDGKDNDVLPTIYSLSDPFSEFRVVCAASTITGGMTPQEPASVPFSATSSGPPPTIQPTDKIVWTSDGTEPHEQLFVTVDVRGKYFRIWRYARVIPEDDEETGQSQSRSDSQGSSQPNLPSVQRGSAPSSGPNTQTTQSTGLSQPTIVPLPSAPVLKRSHSRVVSGSIADLPLPDSGYLLEDTQPTLNTQASATTLHTQGHERADSGTRNELSATLDRMALGTQSAYGHTHEGMGVGSAGEGILGEGLGGARMKPAYWAHELFSDVLGEEDSKNPSQITAALYDSRSDNRQWRLLIALCFPGARTINIYTVIRDGNNLSVAPIRTYRGIGMAAIAGTRRTGMDLLILQPKGRGNESALDPGDDVEGEGGLRLLVGPLTDVKLDVSFPDLPTSESNELSVERMDAELADISISSVVDTHSILSLRDPVGSRLTLVTPNAAWRVALDFRPKDELTKICMDAMGCVLPERVYFCVWRSWVGYRDGHGEEEWTAFKKAILDCAHITSMDPPSRSSAPTGSAFEKFMRSSTFQGLQNDSIAMAFLNLPSPPPSVPGKSHEFPSEHSHQKLLYQLFMSAFHLLFEDFKLSTKRRQYVVKLCDLLVQLAAVFRPEWCDYYLRCCPEVDYAWTAGRNNERLEEDIPAIGQSVMAHLYSRLASPEQSWPVIRTMPVPALLLPNALFDPWRRTRRIDTIYSCFTSMNHRKSSDFRGRAESVVETMVQMVFSLEELSDVPFGIALPIRECLRACMGNPPPEWTGDHYELVGRKDLAVMAQLPSVGFVNEDDDSDEEELALGEKPIFEEDKKSIAELVEGYADVVQANANPNKTLNEMELAKLTKIRFTTDRRLDEVTRILQGSVVQTVKMDDRPMPEHEVAKHQQDLAFRIAERTMALAMGRAIFTFGSVTHVTNDTYRVPKLEYSVRMLPMNVVVAPDPTKVQPDATHWAEFHNGVAAGLRIAPSSHPIASSWITFHKPSELSPEHAGFLYGLGLTGHLKSMLTWHTFTYLTPKHDLTSIAVLLGLSAAWKGTGNRHVRKLLAIHTPALLPKSSMELNIPLLTQAAGISGVGLLYMGTAHRRMAEVCLGEMYKKDASSITSTANATKEAYVVSAALAFGMIMLGRGFTSNNAADAEFVSRLKTMIKGISGYGNGTEAPFDWNAAAPAACIALGLMFLRTNRKDISEIMLLPDSLEGLNRVPPHFLFYRALGRDLIMWDNIMPTLEWIMGHFPPDVRKTMEARARGVRCDLAYEYAYYYTVAAACFAIGLKYAGTAKEQAYLTLMHFYDLYSKLGWGPGANAYDYRIRKASVREGLNMIALALSIVMSGVGEIHCLRRFRFSHGHTQHGGRYGSHVANVMSIGMLFLGGGHYTLGSSDAAIASLVAACLPPFPFRAEENKAHLQALRHLWVLAIEPRCLLARDVSTREVVYLPIKTHIREDDGLLRSTQLISPTLIPNLKRLLAIKVDTPRYWPFLMDLAKVPRHQERIIQDQTLWVKRKTGFLGYSEDPKGSRSIFIRAGAASGDAAMLEFPSVYQRSEDGRGTGPSKDFRDFVSSFSIDPEHLAFADRLCRMDDFESTSSYAMFDRPGIAEDLQIGAAEGWGKVAKDEKTEKLESFAHAAFLECLTLDKPELLPAHIEVHLLRNSHPDRTAGFNMQLDNLVFAAGFYTTVFEKRFTVKHSHAQSHGGSQIPGAISPQPPAPSSQEAFEKVPLMRPAFLLASLLQIDNMINGYTSEPDFKSALVQYCTGTVVDSVSLAQKRRLATYLTRRNVPPADVLLQLRTLAMKAFGDVESGSAGNSEEAKKRMRTVVKSVLHETGVGMCRPSINKWNMRCLEEILDAWGLSMYNEN